MSAPWTEDSSNWHRAHEAQDVFTLIADLIEIGRKVDVATAERIYMWLRDQPRTAHGDVVDWLEIRAEIERPR